MRLSSAAQPKVFESPPGHPLIEGRLRALERITETLKRIEDVSRFLVPSVGGSPESVGSLTLPRSLNRFGRSTDFADRTEQRLLRGVHVLDTQLEGVFSGPDLVCVVSHTLSPFVWLRGSKSFADPDFIVERPVAT